MKQHIRFQRLASILKNNPFEFQPQKMVAKKLN
jgi:hypothetical protein